MLLIPMMWSIPLLPSALFQSAKDDSGNNTSQQVSPSVSRLMPLSISLFWRVVLMVCWYAEIPSGASAALQNSWQSIESPAPRPYHKERVSIHYPERPPLIARYAVLSFFPRLEGIWKFPLFVLRIILCYEVTFNSHRRKWILWTRLRDLVTWFLSNL